MGIFQELIGSLFPKTPRLAPGNSTIRVTGGFASGEFADYVMNRAPLGDFEYDVEAVIYKSPTAEYPRSIRVDHVETRALIGYVMPSKWDQAHKLLADVARAANGAARVRMDCTIFGVNDRDGAEVFSIDLKYAEPLEIL